MRKNLPVYILIISTILFWSRWDVVLPVRATLESCTASVSPSSVSTSVTQNFSFTLNNTGSNPIVLFKITAPSENFNIQSYSASGWSWTHSSSFAIFTGGSIAAGGSLTFTIQARSGSSEAAAANWTMEANDVASEGGTTGCTGSLSTAISGVTDVTPPEMGETITISDVASTSVKISWTTNENATSVVQYGTTQDYGSTATDTTLTTSHSVAVSSLTANTTYYFYVESADSSGNTVTSDEETFVTAVAGTTGTTTTTTTTSTSTTTTTTVTATATPKPTPKPDKIAPVISLDTELEKPFKEAPKITGKASDADSGGVGGGISSIDYSIDDGKNWLPVDDIESVKGKASSVKFEFTPAIFEDGDYKVKVRAKDVSGNLGYSGVKTMVIDRLPPQVGGVIFSLGPQILMPNQDGVVITLAGLDNKITLSAVGGPTGIELLSNLSHLSNLTKNSDNGLWSGTLSFNEPGTYQLLVKSVDGANNKTERKLNTVVVLDSGVVKDQAGKALSGARVSLYYS